MEDSKGSISKEMHDEEQKMREQREKEDAKREAELEKEREEDLKGGKELLDKKFQQLEFLMNKSKVRAGFLCIRLFRAFRHVREHSGLTGNRLALCHRNARANATPGRRGESTR
jgi:ATP-dependent DNA helicase